MAKGIIKVASYYRGGKPTPKAGIGAGVAAGMAGVAGWELGKMAGNALSKTKFGQKLGDAITKQTGIAGAITYMSNRRSDKTIAAMRAKAAPAAPKPQVFKKTQRDLRSYGSLPRK